MSVEGDPLEVELREARNRIERGEHGEARQLYEEAIEGSSKSLGRMHATTLDASCSLADLLSEIGERDKAKELYEKLNKVPKTSGEVKRG